MSNVDEIIKLKELLDKNIISQKEFEKKKNELLNDANNEQKNNNDKSKKRKGILTGIITFIIIIIFIVALGSSSTPSTDTSKINILMNYSLSEEEAKTVINTINDCGYSKYYPDFKLEKSGNNEEIPDSIGFTIKSGQQIIGFIDIKDNKVANIQYSDKILYENGGVQHTLNEYLISTDEKGDLIYKTEEIIKSILKSPSTADFPWDYDEWKVGKDNGSTIIQGYVDSQNGFGAIIRSTFQVTYTNNIVTSLIFDGTEYIK